MKTYKYSNASAQYPGTNSVNWNTLFIKVSIIITSIVHALKIYICVLVNNNKLSLCLFLFLKLLKISITMYLVIISIRVNNPQHSFQCCSINRLLSNKCSMNKHVKLNRIHYSLFLLDSSVYPPLELNWISCSKLLTALYFIHHFF